MDGMVVGKKSLNIQIVKYLPSGELTFPFPRDFWVDDYPAFQRRDMWSFPQRVLSTIS